MMSDDTVTGVYGSGGGNYLKADDLAGEDWELVFAGFKIGLIHLLLFPAGDEQFPIIAMQVIGLEVVTSTASINSCHSVIHLQPPMRV